MALGQFFYLFIFGISKSSKTVFISFDVWYSQKAFGLHAILRDVWYTPYGETYKTRGCGLLSDEKHDELNIARIIFKVNRYIFTQTNEIEIFAIFVYKS